MPGPVDLAHAAPLHSCRYRRLFAPTTKSLKRLAAHGHLPRSATGASLLMARPVSRRYCTHQNPLLLVSRSMPP